MKNITILVAILLFAFSCTDDDMRQTQAEPQKNADRYAAPPGGIRYIPDPMKLQKVVFYPGQIYQKTFNFYPNGLIKNIQNASGNIVEDFIYQDGRLSVANLYLPTETLTLTCSYDGDGHLTFGTPLFYYAPAENMYVDERAWNPSDEGDRYYYVLRPDGLLKAVHQQSHSGEEVHSGMDWYFTYNDNNDCVSYLEDSGAVFYSYDSHMNPLLPAMAPALKALAPYFTSSPYSANQATIQQAQFISQHNMTLEDSDDPSSSTIAYTYNGNDLPVEGTHTWMYGEINEGVAIYAHYYYQGDVIP